MENTKQSESILQLCNKFESLHLDDVMEQPTEAVQKDKSAKKLKRAKIRAKKANAKAAIAKTKLEKLEKLVKLKEVKDMMKTPSDGPSTSTVALCRVVERLSVSNTKKRSSVAGDAIMEAPFDGPSTSKAALRRDEERRSASKAKKHSAIADEVKKKHNSKAVDKKYEGRQAFTFAGYRAPSQFPQRVDREMHISVKLEYADSIQHGKRVMKMQPRVSPMKGKKQQPPELDDRAEFPALGQ